MSNFTFTPDNMQADKKTIYFEDCREVDGWAGMTTGKTESQLKEEINGAFKRLGGMVTGWHKGNFNMMTPKRAGYVCYFSYVGPDQRVETGKLAIAALPFRVRRNYTDERKFQEKALCQALFMFRDALDGSWFWQQLTPGYNPLMPFTIVTDSGLSLLDLWNDSTTRALPEGRRQKERDEHDEGTIDATFTELK